MIKVEINGKSVEGELFAVDPVTKAVALKVDGKYVIVNSSHISGIKGDLAACQPPPISQLGVSTTNFAKKEMTALQSAIKSLNAINNNVSSEVQTLYDRLSFIYPCLWRGNEIVVLEEFLIAPPYQVVQVLPDKDGKGIDRVIKLLEGERKRLNL